MGIAMRDAVELAMEKSGGGAALARQITEKTGRPTPLSRQAVYQWRHVPAELVLIVEQISGVSRHVLRPDLYPPHETRASA